MNASQYRSARRTSLAVHGLFAAAVTILPIWANAQAATGGFDPLGTQLEMTAPPVALTVLEVTGVAACDFGLPAEPLQLEDVAARALCRNPLTGRAWASAQVQAARLGEARAARWPTLSGTMNGSLNRGSMVSANALAAQESYNGTARAVELAFEWVVFDFGARSAEVRKARELMIAAD